MAKRKPGKKADKNYKTTSLVVIISIILTLILIGGIVSLTSLTQRDLSNIEQKVGTREINKTQTINPDDLLSTDNWYIYKDSALDLSFPFPTDWKIDGVSEDQSVRIIKTNSEIYTAI